jgi:ankyrin repeat protein
MQLLLEAGARVDIRNSDGKTALDLAREYHHKRFVRILERRERKSTTGRVGTMSSQ